MFFGRTLFALAGIASTVNALGINCQGSGLCASNKGLLGNLLGQIKAMDQSQTFSDGQHIACTESSVTIGNPSLCIFYQKTGRTFTVAQTVWYVQSLMDHGCTACGSIPVDDGNNVDNGELTANMVTNAKRRDTGMVKTVRKRHGSESHAVGKMETVSKLSKRLGINCRGSSTCSVGGVANLPAGHIDDLKNTIAGQGDGVWGNGQQIGCVAHVTGKICAFYQNVGDRTFTTQQTLMYLDWLTDHGCTVCGSVPTDDGNNVDNGELTVNYVS
ncbi:killer toxin [Trichoderma citrinoviride]|uniref:Killer toxin n=1 Tax=Trichoderma citrinoviride TaxID=58853 RepID=A0A2T4AXA3_9HYPO|nr:killer toxin [Trichoderma citrinoviride]PTB61696.1 killer toxin [Trichoderma citrinoviride]